MEPRLRVASLIASVSLMVFIFELVRRKKLKEKYSLLWLLMGASLLAMVLWPRLAIWLRGIFGLIAISNAIFLTTIGFIVLLCIHFSVRISTLSEQTKVLAQELAMLKDRGPRDGLRGEEQEGKESGGGPSS